MAFEERGGAGLWQETLHNALLIGAAMALFCLVIVFAGEYLLAFLYHDPEYVAYGYVVTLLAFAVSVWAIGMPAESALITIGHPRTALFGEFIRYRCHRGSHLVLGG